MATDATSAPPGDQSTGEQAKEKAQEVATQAQEKLGEAAEQAKGTVRTQIDDRSRQAGEQVASTAGDIRKVAEQLREQGSEQPAKLAEQAADRAERLGSYLTESDADRILRDVEDFARRQPWAVVGAGLFVGFAASRLLKASSSERYQSQTGGTTGQTQRIEPAAQASPTRFGRDGL
jgi:ElaB/YqjD/DUF883 family membrane-anchored ribosome-binding protein